jgi:outer membrane protein TolC
MALQENPDLRMAHAMLGDIYRDETLKALIFTALTNNYDVRIAATRVEQARAFSGYVVLANDTGGGHFELIDPLASEWSQVKAAIESLVEAPGSAAPPR